MGEPRQRNNRAARSDPAFVFQRATSRGLGQSSKIPRNFGGDFGRRSIIIKKKERKCLTTPRKGTYRTIYVAAKSFLHCRKINRIRLHQLSEHPALEHRSIYVRVRRSQTSGCEGADDNLDSDSNRSPQLFHRGIGIPCKKKKREKSERERERESKTFEISEGN